MKEFFKDVGWNALCITGAFALLVVGLALFVVMVAPCFIVPGLMLEHWGKEWYTLLLGLTFMIVYWSIVDVVGSAIWRKITGRPKLPRGYIYIKYAETNK